MRYRWLFIAVLIVVGGGLGIRQFIAHNRAKERLQAWQAEQEREQRLDRPVKISFGASVELTTWLDEWSQQTGIKATFVESAPVSGFGNPMVGPVCYDGSHHIALDLPQLPAREALRAFAAYCNCSWHLDQRGDLSVYASADEAPLVTRTYLLPAQLNENQQEDFADVFAYAPASDSWDVVGGRGGKVLTPGTLTVVHHADAQQQINTFYRALVPLLEQSSELTPAAWLVDDPRLQPVPICENPAAFARLLTALQQKVSFNVVDMPAQDFANKIGEKLGVPVNIDPLTGPFYATTVTLRLNNISLRSLLDILLRERNLAYVPIASGQALLITNEDQLQEQRYLTTCAYQVHDLASTAIGEPDLDPLAELIVTTIETDAWEDVGGTGSINYVSDSPLLVIATTLHNHQRIQGLLAALRKAKLVPLPVGSKRTHPKRGLDLRGLPFSIVPIVG
ncbi:hypothetical protein [Anatilimnocola aggregata]|nr:hypothetical protein [Anatilimnocola aggregata]